MTEISAVSGDCDGAAGVPGADAGTTCVGAAGVPGADAETTCVGAAGVLAPGAGGLDFSS